MNRSTFFVGTIMLAAAAVFIYFEEPPTVRIICAAVFLICAVLLYFTISGDTAADEELSVDGAEKQKVRKGESKTDETLPLDFSERERFGSEKARASAQTVVDESESIRSGVRVPFQRKEVDIPREYYLIGDADVPTDDPRGEFDFLVRKLLTVLKELLIAHSVALFWINHDRRQIVIGEHVSDGKNFTKIRRAALGEDDCVSRIGKTGRPEIISDIPASAERDLLIYYEHSEGVRSFVGVPLYFNGEPIAVVSADSKAADAFGVETVATVGQFTMLIATLLRSYNQKYDLDADARLLATLDRLRASVQQKTDTFAVMEAGAAAVSESLDWDHIALVFHDPKRNEWLVGKSISKGADAFIADATIIDVTKGLAGRAILTGTSMIIDAPVPPDFRFIPDEKIEGSGQLIFVPIMTATRSHGLIVVEYREKHRYGKRELETCERIAHFLGQFLEISSLGELVKNHLLIDEVTRVGSRAFLLKRLQEEHARVLAHDGEVVFFLIAVDSPKSIMEKYHQQGFDLMMIQIGKALQTVMKPFDITARFDFSRFGVVSLYTDAEHAYLQGEKIRKAVAGLVISVASINFSATVSVAGCVLSSGTDPVHALKALQQALEKASAEGGNNVKIV